MKTLEPEVLTGQQATNIAVAKDVLALLGKGLNLCGNLYLRPSYKHTDLLRQIEAEGDFKKLLAAIPEIAKECVVCAKGALVLAHLHLFGNTSRLPSSSATDDYCAKVFGRAMADNIEAAFEGWIGYRNASWTSRFIEDYPDEATRLATIMENIIANNGEFENPDVGT